MCPVSSLSEELLIGSCEEMVGGCVGGMTCHCSVPVTAAMLNASFIMNVGALPAKFCSLVGSSPALPAYIQYHQLVHFEHSKELLRGMPLLSLI